MRRGGLLLFVALVLAGCTSPGTPAPPTPDLVGEGSTPTTPTSAPPTPSATPPATTPTPTLPPTGPEPTPEPAPTPPTTPPPDEAPPSTTPPPAPSPWWPAPSDPAPGPPVRFALGTDAGSGSSFASATIASNRTSFSASLRGVSEATLRVDDLVRVRNTEDRARTIQVSTAQIVDERIVAARLLLGSQTLDLRSAAPSLTVQLSPLGTQRLGFELTVAGVEAEEVVLSQAVGLVVLGS